MCAPSRASTYRGIPRRRSREITALTITANGQYTYTVDPGKVGSADTILSDHFFYKISDSSLQDTGNLGIYIDPHTLTTHMS